MESIIKKTNFVHNDENQLERFNDEINEVTYSAETCTVKDGIKAIAAFVAKLTEKQFPDFDTEGWTQATTAFDKCNRMTTDLLDETNSKPSSIHGDYYEFVLRLMEYGPGTIHMRIIRELIEDSYVEMQEHLKTLKGDKLKRLVSALTKDVTLKEKIKEEEFYDHYADYVRQFIDDVLSEDQRQEHMKTLLDFYTHLILDFTHLNAESYESITRAADYIYSRFDDPWLTFHDTTALKSYLKHCGEPFKNPRFPEHEKAKREVEGFMKTLSKKLGERGKAEEFYQEILDLALVVSRSASSDEEFIQSAFSSALAFFGELPPESIPKKPALFLQAVKKFTSVLEALDMKILAKHRFPMDFLDEFLRKAYGKDKESAKQLAELIIPLLQRPSRSTLRAAWDILCDQDELQIRWKDFPDTAQRLFVVINNFKIPESPQKDDGAHKDFVDTFGRVGRYFFEGLKKSKMLKPYSEDMLKMVIGLIEMNDELLYEMAEEIAERIDVNPKENKTAAVDTMRRLHGVVKRNDYPWNTQWNLTRVLEKVVGACSVSFKDGKIFSEDDLKVYVSVGLTCLQHEPLDPNNGEALSAHYDIFITLMNQLSEWLKSVNRFDLAVDIARGLMNGLKEDSEQVTLLSARFLLDFAQVTSGQKILTPYLGDLIEAYMDNEQPFLLQVIDTVYPFNTKPMNKHFRALLTILEETGDTQISVWLCQIFHKVSKKQPELFTEDDMGMLVKKAKEDMSNQTTLLQILQELCKRRPEAMAKYLDLMMDPSGWNPMLLSWMNDMFCSVAIHDKTNASKVMNYLLNSSRSNQDKANLLTALNSVRLIGFKYPDIIKPRRNEIENLQLQDPDGQSLKQTILDMIDGKTPEELRKQLEGQQQELSNLAERVEDTEEAVTDLKGEVGRQGEELGSVKNEVNKHGERLDQVEETVDDTVKKVEEIDQKTLSHAPFWSRDVSKLLNPQSEHDWRLLASRLGYSNDDIRGWAQQSDPCMAMLNEWYATRKTSEATFAILTQLQEMNRMDAAIIVENAMKNAEAVVEDEDFEYAAPPAVFISYQWAHQPEVKLLKQHLEMAGYECWLDIGQMGGGDKLFEKIDQGIRAAKVVVSCVTTKYAKSPNCNREVNLSVNLNKPIIPLLIEKCTWPPPGSMGPIFSEYLFIRFFQRAGEELEDERYWPKDKFQELLMQLDVLGLPPDEGRIEPIYRNWWLPVVEEIKIDKSKTREGGKASGPQTTEQDEKAAVSPDVFISYQWGKQKNIIKLYERLSSLGFTCWLDIKQMGGGDSLYDKIDKGVRGSKVVLSCVTQKYSLSANCRREVSLADALKKPLIPLLLEKMTWPPSGPMSMVMTQLLYIDFTKDEKVQMTWNGPKFQELLDKIDGHVPLAIEDTARDPRPRPQPASSTSKSVSSTPSQPNQNKQNGPDERTHEKRRQETKPQSEKPQTENESKPEIRSPLISPQKQPAQAAKKPPKSSSCIII